MSRYRETTTYFSPDEFVLMIALVEKLDPSRYASDETKALIYRCRSLMKNPTDNVGLTRS